MVRTTIIIIGGSSAHLMVGGCADKIGFIARPKGLRYKESALRLQPFESSPATIEETKRFPLFYFNCKHNYCVVLWCVVAFGVVCKPPRLHHYTPPLVVVALAVIDYSILVSAVALLT